jgi:hypothetical protein
MMQNTEDFNKLKNTLLQLNGALLKLGLNKEDIIIFLPDCDFNYINRTLATSNSGLGKFYRPVDDYEFTLSGLTIKRYSKESSL